MPKPFQKETDLCAQFIELIDKRIWVPYAETAGWDILLVRKVDGFQIGIQAKLSLNADVIIQAIEGSGHWSAVAAGPDCRAVLVPERGNTKLAPICDYVGIIVITVRSAEQYSYPAYRPHLPDRGDSWRGGGSDWHEWAPTKRHPLPEFIPDVAAGAAAPLQLTEWKIKAIKLAIIMERRGHVMRSDFSHLQMDHRRWIANGWVLLKDKMPSAGWVASKAFPPLKKQHPKNYAEISAKFDVWKPPERLL